MATTNPFALSWTQVDEGHWHGRQVGFPLVREIEYLPAVALFFVDGCKALLSHASGRQDRRGPHAARLGLRRRRPDRLTSRPSVIE